MRPSSVFAGIASATAMMLGTTTASADPAATAIPRDPLVFVADPKFGVETSVRTLDSLGRLAFRYEDALPALDLDDRTVLGKAARPVGRILKLIAIDEPLAELTTTAVHEVAGHGGRARELGLEPTFLFYLPGIYRLLFAPDDKEKAGAFTNYLAPGTIEDTRETVGTLGGLEANYAQAWWTNVRIMHQQGWAHHGDLLTYAVAKYAYAPSFLSSSLETRGTGASNDVASYVSSLQDLDNGWRAEDRRRIARRLRAGYVWNLVDPTLFYALYSTVVSTVILGERASRMPVPTIAGMNILPSPRFGLTPFGAEQALDVFLSRDRAGSAVFDLYARVGTSGLASYTGAGAYVLGLEIGPRLSMGAQLDVWRQPEILLEERALFGTPARVGVNAALLGDVRILGRGRRGEPSLGITGKIAAKTSGYVMGQPIGGGPYGYLGMSVHW